MRGATAAAIDETRSVLSIQRSACDLRLGWRPIRKRGHLEGDAGPRAGVRGSPDELSGCRRGFRGLLLPDHRVACGAVARPPAAGRLGGTLRTRSRHGLFYATCVLWTARPTPYGGSAPRRYRCAEPLRASGKRSSSLGPLAPRTLVADKCTAAHQEGRKITTSRAALDWYRSLTRGMWSQRAAGWTGIDG